jgi:zinc protease
MFKYRLKFFLVLSCSLLASCASGPQTETELIEALGKEEQEIPDLAVHREVLPNGLRILVLERPTIPVASYYTYFDVGGRHEQKGFTGASHFLEHLMFKGAKKYLNGQFAEVIEEIGGSFNAYTTFDSTVYHESFPAKNLEQIIDLESDRMANLSLEQKTFDSERQVVLEERRMRYENSPQGKLFQVMSETMFKGTPYGGSVIGSVADLKSIERGQVQKYFKQFYAPNNAIIVVVGDVRTAETVKLIKKYYGELPRSEEFEAIKKAQDRPELYEPKVKYQQWVKGNATTPTPLVSLVYKGVEITHPDALTLDIVSSILSEGESSFLQQEFVKGKKATFTSLSAGNYNKKFGGIFYIFGELQRGVSLEKTRAKLLQKMTAFCQTEITERALLKAQNGILVRLYSGLTTTDKLADFVGNHEYYYGDFNKYRDVLKRYMSVTVDQAKEACQRTLKSKQANFFSLWDKHR